MAPWQGASGKWECIYITVQPHDWPVNPINLKMRNNYDSFYFEMTLKHICPRWQVYLHWRTSKITAEKLRLIVGWVCQPKSGLFVGNIYWTTFWRGVWRWRSLVKYSWSWETNEQTHSVFRRLLYLRKSEKEGITWRHDGMWLLRCQK